MKTLMFIAALLLTACGTAPGASTTGTVSLSPSPSPSASPSAAATHDYYVVVDAVGTEIAGTFTKNIGLADQDEFQVNVHTPVASENHTWNGWKTINVQFTNRTGGPMTVTLYKDGIVVESHSENRAGFAIAIFQ